MWLGRVARGGAWSSTTTTWPQRLAGNLELETLTQSSTSVVLVRALGEGEIVQIGEPEDRSRTVKPGGKMEPKRNSRSDNRTSLELESAQRALGTGLFWWNQVLSAERASEWKPCDLAAAGASPGNGLAATTRAGQVNLVLPDTQFSRPRAYP